MYKYDKNYISRKASEYGFVRDTLEKVYRLIDILEFLNKEPKLAGKLGLKGGTAINLGIFDFPRLSVDIDLDYLVSESKEKMLENRENINSVLTRYMTMNGYILDPRTKNPHSLDSWVYSYMNLGGNKDNIKIEINYSLRAHVFPAQQITVKNRLFEEEYELTCLHKVEIFGSKINALLNRAAARDLYDVYNMTKFELFSEDEKHLLRKCAVFYFAISGDKMDKFPNTDLINRITNRKIRTELLPVLSRTESFDLDVAKAIVTKYVSNYMVPTLYEEDFLRRFEAKEYVPELLFDDNIEIINRIRSHPMALWRTRSS